MCPGLSASETTHDEWQRLNPVNGIVLYQAFRLHTKKEVEAKIRISQPHYNPINPLTPNDL
jgi:hypothetical protein